MTLPFSLGTLPLPDWLPGWLSAVLLIPIVLWLLAALVMPFAVLGTRSRLEGLEAQIEELHAELRSLGTRFGPPVDAGYDGGFEMPLAGPLPGPRGEARGEARPERRRATDSGGRAEPRFGPRPDPRFGGR